MKEPNPYRSPEHSSDNVGEFRARFDAGKWTARYLQTLGVLSIVKILVWLIFLDRLNLDFSSLPMFWAAHHLLKHNPTARNWVIAICALNLFVMALILIPGVLSTLGLISPSHDGPRHADSSFLPAIMFIAFVILVNIPIWLLNTEEAKREFLVK